MLLAVAVNVLQVLVTNAKNFWKIVFWVVSTAVA
jgi:hypothetical protein